MDDCFTFSTEGQALLLLALTLAFPSALFIRPLRRWISRALGLDSGPAGITCFAIAFLFGFVVVYLQFYRQGALYDTDFPSYYYAARVHRAEGDMYNGEALHALGWEEIRNGKAGIMVENLVQDPPPQIFIYPYIYPPLFATALLPLSFLGLSEASMLFRVVNVVALVLVGVWLLEMYHPPRTERPLYALFLLALLLTSLPVDLTLHHGQVNLLVLFFMMATLRFAGRRSWLAGLCLALAVLLKVAPLILGLWLLLVGRQKAVAWSACFLAALFGMSLLILGAEPWIRYFSDIAPNLRFGASGDLFHYIPELLHPENSPWNQSLPGFMNGILAGGAGAFLGWVLGLLILACCFVVTYRRPGAAGSTPWPAFALLLCGILLVSPITWRHHNVLLLPAYMTLFHIMIREKRFSVLYLFAIIVTNTSYPNDFLALGWSGSVLTHLRLFGLVVLFAILCLWLIKGGGKGEQQKFPS